MSQYVTRLEIMRRIAERMNYQRAADRALVKRAIIALTDLIGDKLAQGHRLDIDYFGAFYVKILPPRRGRNPKTGDPVPVPSRPSVSFKAYEDLKYRVNIPELRSPKPKAEKKVKPWRDRGAKSNNRYHPHLVARRLEIDSSESASFYSDQHPSRSRRECAGPPVWSTRLKVQNAATQLIIPDADGIRVAGILTNVGPIVLLVDMPDRNDGCSLTNCVKTVINHVYRQFLQPAEAFIEWTAWIEVDSTGNFDWVKPTVARDGLCKNIGWVPINNEAGQRSMHAFLNRYGSLGQELLDAIGDTPQSRDERS